MGLKIHRDAPKDSEGEIKLASVRLEYVDMKGKTKVDVLPVYVRTAEASDAPLTRKNLIALEEVIIQESRDALNDVLRHFDQNNEAKAIEVLQNQISRFGAWPRK